MKKDIALSVESFPVCDNMKKPAKTYKNSLQPINVYEKVEIVPKDYMGYNEKLPETPKWNKNFFVIDLLTKDCIAALTANK